VIGAIAALFLVGAWLYAAPRQWRGESGLDRTGTPPAWPFGDAAWRGVARSFVIGTPFVALALAGGAVAELTSDDALGAILGLTGIVGAMTFHLPILLVNRPKAVVPPPLRAQPGAIAEHRA
jgi:hypothetical protein